ncbi:MAG: hypothetical protein NTY19_19015 [Planctomycetota bacterium]|nr:hypothetical protein [Planctomycetota bacterium]
MSTVNDSYRRDNIAEARENGCASKPAAPAMPRSKFEPRPRYRDKKSDGGGGEPIDRVLAAAGKTRKVDRTQWTANCPACRDTGQHLSIGLGDDGTVLLTCHHDCEFDEIVAAMELDPRDLFPRNGTPQRQTNSAATRAKPPAAPHKPKKVRKPGSATGTATLATAPGAEKNWGAMAKQYRAALSEKELTDLAHHLGVTPASLRTLHVGVLRERDNVCFMFPEFNAAGQVIGILKRAADGDKRAITGSKRGIYLPTGWQNWPGPIFVVEGPSDCAALTTMELAAIGRPCATGGVDHLVEVLADVPAERDIIVVGELDAKSDGRWPGKDAAMKVAKELRAKLGRPTHWALPPDGAKDSRAWLLQQQETMCDEE